MAKSQNKKPLPQDIEYWQNELPVGSRISWGAWGRGTIVEIEIKTPLFGDEQDAHERRYFSFIAKFDGDRYSLLHRGVNLGPAGINKLKDDAKIKFGTYCNGRAYPYTLIKQGDIISYDTNTNDSSAPFYTVVGGVYDGVVHKSYLVPTENTDIHWREIDTAYMRYTENESVWINVDQLTVKNELIKLVKAHDPYHEREGSNPDPVEILLSDRLTDEEHMKRRRYLENRFNNKFATIKSEKENENG